ncbi:hypothetical protein WAI453_006128 [Rhynchosporium graminicola]
MGTWLLAQKTKASLIFRSPKKLNPYPDWRVYSKMVVSHLTMPLGANAKGSPYTSRHHPPARWSDFVVTADHVLSLG